MSFYTEYELLEPIPGGTVRSFRARQIATQREVRVHLLVGGNDSIIRQVEVLPAEKRAFILEQGENEGTIFIVTTPLPEDAGLERWLSAIPPASAKPNLGRVGQWDISKLQQALAGPPPAAAAAGPGESTRVFAPPPSSGPGAFTRMFEANGSPPAAGADDCTRVFQAKSDPAPLQTPADESTRLFQAPPPVAAPSSGPGEFTRMFEAPPSGDSTRIVGATVVQPSPAPVQPPAAQPQTPQNQPPQTQAARPNYLPLVPILTGLLLAAIALVAYFALR